MKKTLISAFVFLLLSGAARSSTPVDAPVAELLQHKLDSCVSAFDMPGISAVILLPNDRHWYGASGVSHIYSLKPMDTTLLFYQASVTKLFAATMVLQLVEENRLSLDDTIGMHLPAIHNVPSDTKIRYLLNHRSGLYDILGATTIANEWFAHPDSVWVPRAVIEKFGNDPVFGQDEAFSYSNTNYLVLGMLIENITGNSFASELKKRILDPCELTQTFFPPFDSIAGPQVSGWTSFVSTTQYETDASAILNDCSASMFYTAGALVARPSDVARFTRMLFSGKILKQETLELMKTCTNVNMGHGCNGYGLGTMRYNFDGRLFYGHGGDVSGFTQLAVHNETNGITLVVSINRSYGQRGAIALVLLRALQQALTVGVHEPGTDVSFSVYPNPASSSVHVRFTGSGTATYRIDIHNQLGQRVYSDYDAGAAGMPHHRIIDLAHLPKGMYVVSLSDGLRTSTKNLIVH